jgi:hypothetical protein
LRQAAVGAVGLDHFPDVNLWFLFGHGIFPLTRAYLTSNPRNGARDISNIVPHRNIFSMKPVIETGDSTFSLLDSADEIAGRLNRCLVQTAGHAFGRCSEC